MRSISAASLATLANKLGTEPVIVVEVNWTATSTGWYAGKTYPGIAQGRILEITAIDDVVNYSDKGTNQTVTVTLNDTDKNLLQTMGVVDIHKLPARVWQWFDGIPFSDKFLLFAGIIASPITWKEGDRTLTFTILSRTEDFEVGFAPEEGFFPFTPDNIIGKAWPLVFGNVMRIPCIPLDTFPTGGRTGSSSEARTKDGTGVHDGSLDKKIQDNMLTAAQAAANAQYCFILYLEASYTARVNGELDEFDAIQLGKGPFSSKAKKYLDDGNKFLLQSQKISTKNQTLQDKLDAQKALEKNQIGITNGSLLPQGLPVNMSASGTQLSGYFTGDTYTITGRVNPTDEITAGMDIPEVAQRVNGSNPNITRGTFAWMDAGTPIWFAQNTAAIDAANPLLPIRYVVASGLPVTVQAVYAYQTVQGLKNLYQLPTNYYEVIQLDWGTLPVTMIYVPQALSSLTDGNGNTLGYENEIWATVLSPVGPNMIEILKWLIRTYSKYTYDPVSFASVEATAATYPMNFAVMDQPTLIKLIQDIAYQGRCIIWLKNEVFYIKYLPRVDSIVATINESDILVNTMEIGTTETEDLITKYVATWIPDHAYTKPYKYILRWNILEYGLHEETFDYFAFNTIGLVARSATFWLIRTSNTFKTMTFKLPISFLNIESTDTILLNFVHPWIANTAVPAVVKKATVDVVNYEIVVEVWIPVLLGTMVQYNFAYPADLTAEFVWPAIPQEFGSVLNSDVRQPTSNSKAAKPMSGDGGNGGQIHVTFNPMTWGDGGGDDSFIDPGIITRIDSVGSVNVGGGPPGGAAVTQYQYDNQVIKPGKVRKVQAGVIPSFIDTVNDDGSYDVNVFYSGLGGTPSLVKNVIGTDPKNVLKAGSSCLFITTVWNGSSDGSAPTLANPGQQSFENRVQGSGAGNSTFGGIVQSSNGDGTYVVDVYEKGSLGDPTTYMAVLQVVGDNMNPLTPGTGVMVTRTTFTNSDGSPGVEQVMQAPVWSPAPVPTP